MGNVILVPTDGSLGSIKALQYAVDFAKKMEGEIVLLNVQPNFASPHAKILFSQKDIDEYTQMLSDEAFEKVVEIVKETGVPYHLKMRVGVPKAEICKEALETQADMIVMGYRGLGPIAGAVLGSVSHGVLQDPPCPVTIIR